ncbi:uncharacterized protein LOC130993994 [Salvia miltiorrhiza]|uniref:uncharacterized protein LOC130993994 n=1 Tax=Salvia miltiorrhiza TaxID=226208 RepID=UPI0025AC1DA2|nr:uncharacterized protein LOC130993994 [Salvia miltiorrhiza]
MNFMVWNVRGLTDESKLILKEHCRTFSPLILGIIEPKVAFNRTFNRYWKSLNLIPCFQNSRLNMCSNIWIFSQPDVSTDVIFASDQVVIVDCVWKTRDFRVACVHGASTHVDRRKLWIDILTFATNKYVVLGDFNAVKGAHERSSICRPNAASCGEFCAFIDTLGCIESPTVGLKYTWLGRRFMPSHVESTLDRVFFSDSFAEEWHTIFTQVLPRVTSDHSPIILVCHSAPLSGRRFFRFLDMWTLHPDFLEMVKRSWASDLINTCPIFTVMAKLKRLRKDLRLWNKNTFGHVDKLLMERQQELLEIQERIASEGYTEDLFDKEVRAQASINTSLSCLLQQKSRVKWLHDGDCNTTFFHNMLRFKRKPHFISQLQIDGAACVDQADISRHIVGYFSSLFTEDRQAQASIVDVEAVLDHIITDQDNEMLSRIPNEEEITVAVFQLDSHSSPGPDGFSGRFFHACWDIIKVDVWKAVATFFTRSYLPNGCNSNTLILIPKNESVSTVADLRPIILSNFLFKIISNVLAVRLNSVAEHSISSNQFGFISGRSIHDCIMLGSEGINCLNRSCGGQNMACKVDITKAFDTLRWDFLINVLTVCGYNQRFIGWIEIILKSARLSILYNGELCGYFGCSRGVRQGDPLSPILFGIAEDALSALFINCQRSGHLVLMQFNRGVSFPTHLFYADDILIFCKATKTNAKTLHKILEYYGNMSGQTFSPMKSHIYFSDKVMANTKRQVSRHLPLATGSLPFTYLGVPIFRGKPKASHLRSIHDRIINKFGHWKGIQLSMAGRLCLIKSVISSSLTHSMLVYRWPHDLLKSLDSSCRNFLWNGDIRKKPVCSVSWDRVCSIKSEGGLGVRSFKTMNKCFLMKMAWKVIEGNSFGYDILKQRYLTPHCSIKSVTASSVWLGLRGQIGELVADSYSYIGNGMETLFWMDDWLGYRLVDKCGVPCFLRDNLDHTVADYFFDGIWHFTPEFVNTFPQIVCDILLVPMGDSDTRFWKPSLEGKVTSALAFAHHGQKFPQVSWGSWIWEPFIPVRRSLVCWRLLHDRMPTYDRLIRNGLVTPNWCPICRSNEETVDHTFWNYAPVRKVWEVFLTWFNFPQGLYELDIKSFLVTAWNRKSSSQVQKFWKAGIITIIWAVWTQRNSCIFDDKQFSYRHVLHLAKVAFVEMEQNFKHLGHMNNEWSDYVILREIGVKGRTAPPPKLISVSWWPPSTAWMKVNTDGSALGAPGAIGVGGIFRDNWGWVRGCFHYKQGTGYAFEAELMAVIIAIRIAHARGWLRLWMEADSTYVVSLLQERSNKYVWICVLTRMFELRDLLRRVASLESWLHKWWSATVERSCLRGDLREETTTIVAADQVGLEERFLTKLQAGAALVHRRVVADVSGWRFAAVWVRMEDVTSGGVVWGDTQLFFKLWVSSGLGLWGAYSVGCKAPGGSGLCPSALNFFVTNWTVIVELVMGFLARRSWTSFVALFDSVGVVSVFVWDGGRVRNFLGAMVRSELLKSFHLSLPVLFVSFSLVVRRRLRTGDGGEAYISDNGNYIIDLYFEREIEDLNEASDGISRLQLPWIVEHGMFIVLASSVMVAGSNGVTVKTKKKGVDSFSYSDLWNGFWDS